MPEYAEYGVENLDTFVQENDLHIDMEMDIPHMQDAPFPTVMLGFAIIKDFIIDPIIFGVILVVFPLGMILKFAVNTFFTIIFMFWFYHKSSYLRRKMQMWLLKRVVLAFGITAIPGAGFIIPELTILVLLAHYREKKMVESFNKVVEGVYVFS